MWVTACCLRPSELGDWLNLVDVLGGKSWGIYTNLAIWGDLQGLQQPEMLHRRARSSMAGRDQGGGVAVRCNLLGKANPTSVSKWRARSCMASYNQCEFD